MNTQSFGIRKLVLTAVIAAPLALSLGVGVSSDVALARSPSEEQCEADGGEFRRDGGNVSCIKDETVGNAPEHSNAQRVKKIETSNGNLTNDNSPHKRDVCDGPGNSQSQC